MGEISDVQDCKCIFSDVDYQFYCTTNTVNKRRKETHETFSVHYVYIKCSVICGGTLIHRPQGLLLDEYRPFCSSVPSDILTLLVENLKKSEKIMKYMF